MWESELLLEQIFKCVDFQLDLRQGALKMEDEELVLNHHNNMSVSVLQAEDIEINGRS